MVEALHRSRRLLPIRSAHWFEVLIDADCRGFASLSVEALMDALVLYGLLGRSLRPPAKPTILTQF